MLLERWACYTHPAFQDVMFELTGWVAREEEGIVVLRVIWWNVSCERPFRIMEERIELPLARQTEFVEVPNPDPIIAGQLARGRYERRGSVKKT